MFPRLLALAATLGILTSAASAGFIGTFTGMSRVATTPLYVRLRTTDFVTGTGIAILGNERITLEGNADDGFSGVFANGDTIDVVKGSRNYVATVTSAELEEPIEFRLNAKPRSVSHAGFYTLYAPGNLKSPPPPSDGEGGNTEEEEPTTVLKRPKLLDGHGIGVVIVTPSGYVRGAFHLADDTRVLCGGPFSSHPTSQAWTLSNPSPVF